MMAQQMNPKQILGTAVVQSPTGSQTITGTLNVKTLQGMLNVNQFTGSTTNSQTLAAQTACGGSTNGCYLIIPPGTLLVQFRFLRLWWVLLLSKTRDF